MIQPALVPSAAEASSQVNVRIDLLGGFRVAVDDLDVPPSAWRRRHAAGLVKLLAISPSRRLHRERAIDALWPDLSIEEAAPRLHKAAHYARRAMGDARSLVAGDESVALWPDAEVAVDVARFERLAGEAIAGDDPAGAGRAADAYGGELLPDDAYEAWTEQLRERLRLLHTDLLRLAGRWQELVAADPADEGANLALVDALATAGQPAAALRQLERLDRAMRRELGVAPGPAARRWRDRLLSATHAGTTDRSPPAEAPVGRDAQIRAAEQVLAEAGAGHARVLFFDGSAGIGKTTLLAWMEQLAARRGMRVGTGVAAEVEGAWPYAPVLEALADLCRRHPALLDGLQDPFREEIERALSGEPVKRPGSEGHQRLFVAAAELLRLAAAGAGAALVVDDAQAADEASLRLLHHLARSTATERVVIILAHRPSPGPALANLRGSLAGRGVATVIDVPPLTRDAALRLTRRYAPGIDEATADALWSASGGVPYSVVETARRLAADPHADLGAALLPAGLAPEVVDALRAAAVLGSSFDTDEFAAAVGAGVDVFAILTTAVGCRLLTRTASGFTFGHALVRAALLERLPPQRRAALHRAAADALRQLGRPAARIGRHLVLAGDRAAAVPWMLAAAETEAALGAYQDALGLLDDVRSAATGRELASLLALRGDLLIARADPAAVEAYQQALAATEEPAKRRSLRARLARAAMFAGDLELAGAALDGLTMDGADRDAGLLLTCGHLAFLRGDHAGAELAASRARRLLAEGGSPDRQLFDLVTLQGLVAHHRGEWFQRLRSELRHGARHPGLTVGIFDSHLCVAEYLLYGPTPYDEVLELAAELRDTATQSGVLRAVAFAAALRGEAALLKGDLDLAEGELQEAVDLHHDLDSSAGEAHSLQRLAEVRLARGDAEEATRLLHRALPLARWSMMARHLLQRVYGTMIEAAPDLAAARAVVDRGGGDARRGRRLLLLLHHAGGSRGEMLRCRRRPRRRAPPPPRCRTIGSRVGGHSLGSPSLRGEGPSGPRRGRRGDGPKLASSGRRPLRRVRPTAGRTTMPGLSRPVLEGLRQGSSGVGQFRRGRTAGKTEPPRFPANEPP